MAQSVSYKTFYLISRRAGTLSEAEAANSLREGLNQLWEHVSTQNPDKLEEAYNAFQASRTRRADFYEAYLYEGIALDLLSQHDEAIKRFAYLENESRLRDTSLRQKAIYNKAISLSRKYQPGELKKAEEVLRELIDSIAQEYEERQIKAMALAAKASVIALYPMYADGLHCDGNNAGIPDYIARVSEIKKQLDGILRTVKEQGKWDRGAESQLEWAINNAWGSVHLNTATYLCPAPNSDGAEKDKNTRVAYLETAYEAFQDCALLLTPGVENLTNLAKVTLELGRFVQGCTYLEEVRRMNPSYEYAYYRLAKEWDKKQQSARVVEIMKSFLVKRTPVIPSFVALVEKYKGELDGLKN